MRGFGAAAAWSWPLMPLVALDVCLLARFVGVGIVRSSSMGPARDGLAGAAILSTRARIATGRVDPLLVTLVLPRLSTSRLV